MTTFFVRFRSSSLGWQLKAESAKQARECVALSQGVFADSAYIKVSRKPESGVVYGLELPPPFLPQNRAEMH